MGELGVGTAFDGMGSVARSGAGGDAGSGLEAASLGAIEGVKFQTCVLRGVSASWQTSINFTPCF